jgi:hypothetical protein
MWVFHYPRDQHRDRLPKTQLDKKKVVVVVLLLFSPVSSVQQLFWLFLFWVIYLSMP